jgi:hypothetical protein
MGVNCSGRCTSVLLSVLNRALVEAVPLASCTVDMLQWQLDVTMVDEMTIGVSHQIIPSKCWARTLKTPGLALGEFTRNYGYCSTGII